MNTDFAIVNADWLACEEPGVVVYVPHAHGTRYDELRPHSYEWWMRQCLAMVGRADAVLRVPGESPGADREVAYARALGVPVFADAADLLWWIRRGGQ